MAEAIALAYQSNPALQSQRAQLQATDEDYVQAQAGFRPTLNGQGQATYSKVPANNPFDRSLETESNAGDLFLSVTQPLYTGGRVTAQIGAAKAGVYAAREQLRAVEASVLLSVVQAYLDVVRDRRSLEVERISLAALKDATDEIAARAEAGANTRTDVQQALAQLEAARAQLTSAQAQLEISNAEYVAAVGHPPDNLPPPPTLPALPPTLDAAFGVAEEENPSIRQAQFTEAVSRAQVQEARAAERPTLSLNGSIGYTGPLEPFYHRDEGRSVTVTATLNQPIFTGGTLQSQIRQATARDTSARIQVEVARRSAIQAVSQAWSVRNAAHLNTLTQVAQVRAAQGAFDGMRIEYRAGLRATLDVLIAQQTLRGAQIALVVAERDEYVATASLLQAVGRLEARVLVQGVPLYRPEASFDRVRQSGFVPWEIVPATLDKVGAPGLPGPGPVPRPDSPSGPVRMTSPAPSPR